ncbi:hypothetical protein GCM10010967_09030 [Dyadobacter beijingensis]|uniref:Uncharacterized protein n=1 Tax=Dyadobacter beijingensis TaxID=365489 RepID=A0ABQ2HGZ0_9BACT|nr:hypothetical protein [Dyadobacter beijingensis]GGM79510.1 hypothetical protein GCM10010967_09030 [Dyadobacter beijingensis]
MKTYRVKAVRESEEALVLDILQNLQRKGTIVFEEEQPDHRAKETTPATEEQVQEIIDEAELGPYYSEQEAKNILHL